MRWDELFGDLEAQAAALADAESAGEIDERTRIETGQLLLTDRLRPSEGAVVRVRCAGGVLIAGLVRQVAPDWLLVDEGGGREAIISVAAISTLAGLSRQSAASGSSDQVSSRLRITHALRGVARDRSSLRLHLCDGDVLDGTLDRVGADFLDVAVHAPGELRRRSEVRETVVVPLHSLAVLRRDA